MSNVRLFLFGVFLFSHVVLAGELIYRDGGPNQNCQSTEEYGVKYHPAVSVKGVLIPASTEVDKSITIYTLICNGSVISTRKVSKDTSPKCLSGQMCSPPSISYINDDANFQFNYDLPGIDVVFGSISKKSNANVFAQRALSRFYLGYSNDGVLDKPVILVEGYDPENNIYPAYYYKSGFNRLVDGGRDLIIVNFANGAADINENAVLLQNIIQEINNSKVGNFPTAVIGYSMGGVVARKAIKNMEIVGINPQVSPFISFDAPHLGANIPATLISETENQIKKMDRALFGYTPPQLSRARNLYNATAARQMRIGSDELITARPVDFPVSTVRIGVTSGSVDGIRQSSATYSGQVTANFCAGFNTVWLGVTILSMCEDMKFISAPQGGIFYDDLPGSYYAGFYSGVNYNLYDYVINIIRGGSSEFQLYTFAADRQITFVPTTSALAMSNVSFDAQARYYYSSSPFDEIITNDAVGGVGANQPHNVFGYYQITQIITALNRWQIQNAGIPDRSLKKLN